MDILKQLIKQLQSHKKKVIFISHPVSNDYAGNYLKIQKIAKYWWNKGYFVLAPQLMFGAYMDSEKDRKLVMLICYICIIISSEVKMYGETKDCLEEWKFAEQLDKKVTYYYPIVEEERI